MEITGKVLLPFDTGDLSYLLSIPYLSLLDFPRSLLPFLPIQLMVVGHFLVIFLTVDTEADISAHLPSFLYLDPY